MFSANLARQKAALRKEHTARAALEQWRANGAQSLVEFWTKASLRNHFNVAAAVCFISLAFLVFAAISGQFCRQETALAEYCFSNSSLFPELEFRNITDLASFCCHGPGSSASSGVDNESISLCFGGDTNGTGSAVGNNFTFSGCCAGLLGSAAAAGDFTACKVFDSLLVFDSLVALVSGLVSACLGIILATLYVLFKGAVPEVQAVVAGVAIAVGCLFVSGSVWNMGEHPSYCLDFLPVIPQWIQENWLCSAVFDGNQLTLGGNFASEMFTYRCAEMVGTAGISCMLLVLVVNTLRLAQQTNAIVTRSIGLHVAIALLFAARIVCFLVMNQQFGIIPFVHLYSCLFICSFLDKAAMDTAFLTGFENRGLLDLGAHVVIPETCTSGSLDLILGSVCIFVVEIGIMVWYASSLTIAQRLANRRHRPETRATLLRFTFYSWHIHTFLVVLVVLGVVIISATSTFADDLFEYNFGPSRNDGAGCAFLFENINLGNVTFGELAVPFEPIDRSFYCVNHFFEALHAHRAGLPLPAQYNTSITMSVLESLGDIPPISPSIDDTTVAQLYFCCHMDEYADLVRYNILVNLGVNPATPMVGVISLVILGMLSGAGRGLLTVPQTASRLRRFLCIQKPSGAQLENRRVRFVNSVHDVINAVTAPGLRRSSRTPGSFDREDVELGASGRGTHHTDVHEDRVSIARKALVAAAFFDLISTRNEGQLVRSADEREAPETGSGILRSSPERAQASSDGHIDQEGKGAEQSFLPKTISTSALLRAHAQTALGASHVIVRPSRHTVLLERQILMATLSDLCYHAARLAKAAAVADADNRKVRRQSMSSTATFQFQQSLHELLSPAETGMHSRALHYNLEHEVFCWVVEAPSFIAVVWRGTATLKNVFDDLNMTLAPLPESMETPFDNMVKERRRRFRNRHPTINVRYINGNDAQQRCCRIHSGKRRYRCSIGYREAPRRGQKHAFEHADSEQSRGIMYTKGVNVSKAAHSLRHNAFGEHYIKNQEQRLKLSGPEHKLGRTEWAELQEAVAHATVADYERGKARVHKGFLAAYLRVRDEVLQTIQRLRTPELGNLPVLVTGHSMGGALATLSAFDLAQIVDPKYLMCSTFGCPRVGNVQFKRNYEALTFATWRFAANHDPVTRMPTYFLGQK
eukprot:INCI5053.17.p1 GENE.INCI5053.17~~INCI5053.17.p1  ORF type:complete len:1156 (+),score=168.17 INCI5053.17:92-3559(+)